MTAPWKHIDAFSLATQVGIPDLLHKHLPSGSGNPTLLTPVLKVRGGKNPSAANATGTKTCAMLVNKHRLRKVHLEDDADSPTQPPETTETPTRLTL